MILHSHPNFLWPFLPPISVCCLLFSAPPFQFCVLYFSKGVLCAYTVHLTLLLFSHFLSFFSYLFLLLSPLFSFLSSLLLSSLFFLFFLSLQIFGATTAAMPHYFQQTWNELPNASTECKNSCDYSNIVQILTDKTCISCSSGSMVALCVKPAAGTGITKKINN